MADRIAGSRRALTSGFRSQQRAHLGLVLIAIWAVPAFAGDISFSPDLTNEEFRDFSELVSQVLYASPVTPAEGGNLIGFDLGIAMTGVEISEDAAYYLNSVSGDITSGGYLVIPRAVLTKGFGGWSLSASYGVATDSDIELLGAAIDLPIVQGGYTTPTIALRGTWSDLRGVEAFDLTTYGVEGFIGKAFGPVTPYAGFGIARTEAKGRVPATDFTEEIRFNDQFELERITGGVRVSLALIEIVVEATESADTSYSARVTFGF